MTVQSLINKINHSPDGIQTAFTFNFRVNEAGHMKVYADGEVYEEPFTLSSASLENDSGGEVEFTNPPSSSISVLTLRREIPFIQGSSYPEYDPFKLEVHERIVDNITMMVQQLQEEISRALLAPIDTEEGALFSLPTYEANKGLMWHPSEHRITNTENDLDSLLSDTVSARDVALSAASSASESAIDAAASAASAAEGANIVADYVEDGSIIEVRNNTVNDRQVVLTSPDLEATPGTVKVAAPFSGDLTNTYHTLGLDCLTGSRGYFGLIKDKNGDDGTYVLSSGLGCDKYLRTHSVNPVNTSSTLIRQGLTTGVEIGDAGASWQNCNMMLMNTTHTKRMPDGSYWEYNPLSGFAVCVMDVPIGDIDIRHPMGKKALFLTYKYLDYTSNWSTTRWGANGDVMVLDGDAAEGSGGAFRGEPTDTYIPINTTWSNTRVLIWGFFGDPLDYLEPGMAGKRGVTAYGTFTGETTIDTGITDPKIVIVKSLGTGDWFQFNVNDWAKFTKLNSNAPEGTWAGAVS
jgi:hypothetical protein